jgi:cation/acetate symporter
MREAAAITPTASPTREVTDHLSRICGVCATGFLVFIVALSLLERTGLAKETVGALFVFGALAIAAVAGVASSTASIAQYEIAGRRLPAVFAGVAAGAEWTSAAIILSATGSLFLANYDGHAVLLGLTGGYLLAAVFIAPFLRNLGAASVPDFIGARFGGLARLLAVVVLIACSVPFMIALFQGATLVLARSAGMSGDAAAVAIAAAMALCALPSGLRSVTAAQTAQYVVLVLGCVALFVIVEAKRFDPPAGTLYDPLVQALHAIARGMGLTPSSSPRSVPFYVLEALGNLELVLCLLLGTASLPHTLTRYAAVPRSGGSRAAASWSLLFIALLVFTLPTFVALLADDLGRERSGVLAGLVAAIMLTAMLATLCGVALTLANSIAHDIGHKMLAPKAGPHSRLIAARALLVILTVAIAYVASSVAAEPVAMVAWAFSLAAAGLFPALILGIWWQRTTAAATVCGIAAGFGVALFYVVVSRYYPQLGVRHFGMTSLLDPANAQPLVDVASILTDPRWLADMPASAANPLAGMVGWLNVRTIACGVFGVPVGFLTIVVLSLLGRPSPRTQAALDAVRTPAARAGEPPHG